jgi:hypothetical protein
MPFEPPQSEFIEEQLEEREQMLEQGGADAARTALLLQPYRRSAQPL